jgi:signal transduction histidine kinase
MTALTSKYKKSIRAKILVPFVTMIVVAIVLGTFNFIHVMSGVMESNIEKQIRTLASTLGERLSNQEKRIVFHAQNMAETKNLADLILDTNQVRLLQIQELQALRAENIRFMGIYGEDTAPEDPLYPIVQTGLRGIRITALTRMDGPEGTALHLVGVAPVPGQDRFREVVLLGTELNHGYLRNISRQLGAEIVLFDREHLPVVGSLEDTSHVEGAFSKAWLEGALLDAPMSEHGSVQAVEVNGNPYKAIARDIMINYEKAGSFVLMLPVQSFYTARLLLVSEAVIYASAIILVMTVFYLLIIRGITTPLRALEQASRKIMRNEPTEPLAPVSDDEIGTLTNTFNEMSRTLETRESQLHLKALDFKNKKEELNSILQHMADGVVVQNRDYNIEYMNAAAIASFGNHVGEKCYEALHDRTEPCNPCSMGEILHGRKPIFQYSSKDSAGRFFEVISQPLRDGEEITKIITLWRDVTERMRRFEQEKKIQEKIQAERLNAIRQIVVSIKHGINNSLTAIFGSLEVLKQRNDSRSDEDQEVIGLLESGAKNIRDIITKLSNISDPVVTEYMEDISMIDLEKSLQNEKGARNDPPSKP